MGYWEKNQQWPEKLTLAFAALLVFYKGDYKGEIIPVNDDKGVMEFFKNAWAEPSLESSIRMILANEILWGQNLDELPELREKVVEVVKSILS